MKERQSIGTEFMEQAVGKYDILMQRWTAVLEGGEESKNLKVFRTQNECN
jgi:hypothetical protein